MMRAARVALGAGLLLIVLALGLVLSGSPAAVLGSSGAPPEEALASVRSPVRLCQGGESLPRGTSAIVVWLGAALGPSVVVDAVSGGRLVAHGEAGAGWTGKDTTIPVRTVARTIEHVTLCFKFAPTNEAVIPGGRHAPRATPTTLNGKAQPWRMTIEYLGDGRRSWWSRGSSIAYHMGLGRLPSGAWAPVVAIVLALALVGATSALLVKELR
jgi:hypothetical protein